MGRLSLRHGMKGKRSYTAWRSMKSRCLNPNNASYKNYGGRGITICPQWTEDFVNFYSDISRLFPDGEDDIPDGLTIERKNTNGNYEPSNVELKTTFDQNRNKRSNVWLTVMGETKLLVDWCRESRIGRQTVRSRLAMGWEPARAISHPVDVRRRRKA